MRCRCVTCSSVWHTVQVCTGVMKMGYRLVQSMQESLLAFMERVEEATGG